LTIILLTYTVIGGYLFDAPRLAILNETIRVLHFHVPMWFGMVIILLISIVYSIRYLSTGNLKYDLFAVECVNTGVVLGLLGIVTGMLWANYTWGSPWHGDPKQNGAAIALLVYLAYLVLRNSMDENQQKARVSNVYNIFAFAAMVPLLFILPRLTSSVHPGSGGNPGFNAYDLDSNLRIVFYPAVVGWTLLGLWIATIRYRSRIVEQKLKEKKYA